MPEEELPVSGETGGKVPRRVAPVASPHVGQLAELLRTARNQQGMTQRQLATEVGVSPGLIGQIETSRSRPSVGTLLDIARVLGLSLDGLFSPASDPAEPPALVANGMIERLLAAGGDRAPGPPRRRPALPPDASIEARVARAGHREIIALEGGVTWELLTPEVDHHLTFMLVNYPAGTSSTSSAQLLRHDDFEYFYILDGTLHVSIGFEETVLDRGDSMSFDSARPHRFSNRGDVPASGLWCVARKTAR